MKKLKNINRFYLELQSELRESMRDRRVFLEQREKLITNDTDNEKNNVIPKRASYFDACNIRHKLLNSYLHL